MFAEAEIFEDKVNISGVERYVKQGEQITASLQQRRQMMRQKKYDTIAVHGIYDAEESLGNQGSIIEPAYSSSAQHFENSDHMEAALGYLMPAWAYSRVANPTVGYLEETVALLEGYGFAGEVSACATSSGMAAIFMATNPFLDQDSGPSGPMNIVASAKCYGGTYMLFNQRYGIERGVEIRWVRNALDPQEWASLIDENTRFVYGEMPSNPSLAVFDLSAIATLAHKFHTPLIVDSTVATSALLRPLRHGADIVVHSMTKSMSSSGLAIAGAVIAKHDIITTVGPDEMRQNFATYVKLLPFRDHGPSLSPFSALMILNDLRTLRSKMDLMSQNSMRVAEFLDTHPVVESVAYPGLANFAGHAVAKDYMWLVDSEDTYEQPVNRYGHLLSFNVKGGHAAARNVFDRLQMIWRATDLGRIKSVATIPTISTHQQQGDEGRDLASIPVNLIRLSVGAENYVDIIADLEQALGAS